MKMKVTTYIKSLGFTQEEEASTTMIVNALTSGSNYDITFDLSDMQMVLNNKQSVFYKVTKVAGKNAAQTAIEQTLHNIETKNGVLKDISGVLLHFKIHPNFLLMKIAEAMETVYESVDEDADILFGTTCDGSLELDYVELSMLLTC